MRLIALNLKNFKVMKSVDIEFPDGILAIIGPNEAGKSTIITALLFALFGQQSLRSFENLVHFESIKARISLIFDLKGKKYQVTRVLTKSKKGSISQTQCEFSELDNEHKFSLAVGPSNVDPLIVKTIGFKYSELTSSNIIAQKKLDKISKLSPQQWKDLLNEFLNLKGFSNAISELKEEYKKLSSSLENNKIRFDKLTGDKNYYWLQFKNLVGLSKEHFKNAMKVRTLIKIIDKNAKNLEIIREFIQKRDLERDLEEKKQSKNEILSEKKARVEEIENLERENEKLREQLEEFANILEDDQIVIELKELFDIYKKLVEKIKELKKEIEYLENLEKQLEKCESEFESYFDTPDQLKIFYNLQSQFESLENNILVKEKFDNEFENIIIREERNATLNIELNSLNEILAEKPEYLNTKDLFQEFKAKIEQNKYDMTQRTNLRQEILVLRKKCPEDTPEEIEQIIDFKEEKRKSITGGFKTFFMQFKLNLPLTIFLILSAIFFPIFGLYIISFVCAGLLGLFLTFLVYKYFILKKFVETLEKVIFSLKLILKIDSKLKEVEEQLRYLYRDIDQIILKLIAFYSEYFESKTTLNDQEYHLNLYFQRTDEKLKKTETKQKGTKREIKENNKIIVKKPEIEKKIADISNQIKRINDNLDIGFSKRLKKKYKIEKISHLYKEKNINFLKIKEILSRINKLLQTDYMEYNRLNDEINKLKVVLEDKPLKVIDLEDSQNTEVNLFNNMVKQTEDLTPKYINLITVEYSIPDQIKAVSLFEASFNNLTRAIHKDKNKKDELEAQIHTNNITIEKKPQIIKELSIVKTDLERILKKIKEIVFPTIPQALEEYFEEDNPEKCKISLQNKINDLNEEKNQLKGEMNNINEQRFTLRQYLIKNEKIIHNFFQMQKNIKKQELDVKVNKKATNLIDQVNREIWDMQMPHIEGYIREFLPKITLGRYRTMNIKQPESKKLRRYEFKVFEETTESFIEKKFLSGGTQDQILLVVRVAFGMSLLPQSKGTYPKFLFLDEVFASSDSERRMEILNWLTKDLLSIFSQIIIISHQREIIEKIPNYYKLSQGKIIEKVIP